MYGKIHILMRQRKEKSIQSFDSSAHRTGCCLWCLMCCKDLWFPFPGFLIFLSVWNFPFHPGKERCHEVSFSSSFEKDLHPLPPKPHVHLSMYTALR